VRAGTDLYLQLSRSGDGWRRTDRALCRGGGQVRGPGFSGLGPEDPIVDSAGCDGLDRAPWAALAVPARGRRTPLGPVAPEAASLADCSPVAGWYLMPVRGRAAVRRRPAVVAAGTVAPVTGWASR
jgi:hypothetical protein